MNRARATPQIFAFLTHQISARIRILRLVTFLGFSAFGIKKTARNYHGKSRYRLFLPATLCFPASSVRSRREKTTGRFRFAESRIRRGRLISRSETLKGRFQRGESGREASIRFVRIRARFRALRLRGLMSYQLQTITSGIMGQKRFLIRSKFCEKTGFNQLAEERIIPRPTRRL